MLKSIKSTGVSILLVASLLSLGWLGYDTYSDMKDKISQQEKSIKELSDKNSKLQEDLNKANEYNGKKEEIREDFNEVLEETKRQQSEARESIEKMIRDLDKKYESLPKTPESEAARQAEYSLKQARGAWAIYCIQVTEDPLCK